MATEFVNIGFRATGIPVIKRALDQLGHSADRATRGVYLLQRALYVLGGFGVARALIQTMDALTGMENRIRLVTSSTQELNNVQRELFDIANRSRQSWQATSEIFNRAALSAQALGISMQDVLTFTEGVSKAAVVSGAGTQESRAALVQLGQAMASNRLGGDELRSILEQLPYVADVIANYMTSTNRFGVVTRGNIRRLGSEGKITAQIMVDAFKWAEADLDKLFANMPTTIGQGFEILKNETARLIDTLDDLLGISNIVGKSLMLLGKNLDFIAMIAGIAAVTVAMMQFAKIGTFIAKVLEMKVARRTAHLAILQAENGAIHLNALAENNATRASIARTTAESARIAAMKLTTRAEYDNAVAAFQNGRARDAQTGRFVALSGARARLMQATIQLSRVEAAEAANIARLNALRGQQTAQIAAQVAATNANTAAIGAANARLVAAQAAQAGFMGRLATSFPALAGIFNTLGRAFSFVATGLRFIAGFAAANPIGAIVVAVFSVIAAFIKWGNQIKVTADGVVGARDAVVAAFQLAWEWLTGIFKNIVKAVSSMADSVFKFLTSAFFDALPYIQQAVTVMINIMTFIPRVAYSAASGVAAAFEFVPEAIGSAGYEAAQFFLDGIKSMVNGAIKGVNAIVGAFNGLLSFFSADKALQFFGISGQISQIPEWGGLNVGNPFAGAGATAGAAFLDGFEQGWNESDPTNVLNGLVAAATPAWNAVIDRARQNIANRQLAAAPPGAAPPGAPTGGGGGGGGGGSAQEQASFQKLFNNMMKEQDLLRKTALERERLGKILEFEEELKRSLTELEREMVIEGMKSLDVARREGEILDELIGKYEEYGNTLQALQNLQSQGAITAQQYTMQLMSANADILSTQTNTMAGIHRAVISSMQEVMDFSKNAEKVIGSLISGLADGLTDFVMTGKLDFKDLADSLIRDIVRMSMQAAISGLFGSIMGSFSPMSFGGGMGGIGMYAEGGIAGQAVKHFGGDGGLTSGIPSILHPNEAVVPLSRGRAIPVDMSGVNLGGGAKVQVNVINQLGTPADVSTETRKGAQGEDIVEVVLKRTKAAIAADIASGGTEVNSAMERRYGLSAAAGNVR